MRRLLAIIAALAVGLASGCVRPAVDAASSPGGRQRQAPKPSAREPEKIDVGVHKGHFIVDDANGKPLMEARAEEMRGLSSLAGKVEGDITMTGARATLHKNGKPETMLTAPAAVWDGQRLRASPTVEGDRADGRLHLQAKQAVWDKETRRLELTQARLRQQRDGSLVFSIAAPTAVLEGDSVVLPQGGVGLNGEGSRLEAGRANWNLRSGVLEASARVKLTSKRLRVDAGRLHSDTRLRQARLSGRVRGVMYRQTGSRVRPVSGHPQERKMAPTATARSFVNTVAVLAVAMPLALVAAAPAQAQAAPPAGDVQYKADDIVLDDEKGLLKATGHVWLDNGAGLQLRADALTLQLQEDNSVDWARVTGNVRLERGKPGAPDYLLVTGARAYYQEAKRQAELEGNVRALISSERLARPAMMSGARIELALDEEVYIVRGGSGAPARIEVQPLGKAGKPKPGAAVLAGTTITLNHQSMSAVATGKPSLIQDDWRLTGDTIRFQVDEKTHEIRQAQITGNVVCDGKDKRGSRVHATSQNAVFDGETRLLTLTGKVELQRTAPGADQPSLYRGTGVTYNVDTGAARAKGAMGVIRRKRPAKPKSPAAPPKPQSRQ